MTSFPKVLRIQDGQSLWRQISNSFLREERLIAGAKSFLEPEHLSHGASNFQGCFVMSLQPQRNSCSFCMGNNAVAHRRVYSIIGPISTLSCQNQVSHIHVHFRGWFMVVKPYFLSACLCLLKIQTSCHRWLTSQSELPVVQGRKWSEEGRAYGSPTSVLHRESF